MSATLQKPFWPPPQRFSEQLLLVLAPYFGALQAAVIGVVGDGIFCLSLLLAISVGLWYGDVIGEVTNHFGVVRPGWNKASFLAALWLAGAVAIGLSATALVSLRLPLLPPSSEFDFWMGIGIVMVPIATVVVIGEEQTNYGPNCDQLT